MTACAWSRPGLAAFVSGCVSRTDPNPGPVVDELPSTVSVPRDDAHTPPPVSTRSPGGTPEASTDALAAARCNVRVVDVRRRVKRDTTGVIPGSEHLPLEHLANRAIGWGRSEAIVVCRSGRRSGAAARELAEMGFEDASSLTGRVLVWSADGGPWSSMLRTRRSRAPRRASVCRPSMTSRHTSRIEIECV